MIDFSKVVKSALALAKQHAPTFLSVTGSIGVATTGLLAIKGYKKYAKSMLKESHCVTPDGRMGLTRAQVAKIYAQAYTPAIISGAASVACILGSTALSHSQQASLMSAYCALGNAFLGYQQQNVKIFGEENDKTIRRETAKVQYETETFEDRDDETKLFYLDSYGYFQSTIERVLMAEYRLNKKFKDEGWCNINDLHEFLDLEPVDGGEYQAWYSHSCRVTDEEPAFEGILDFMHDIVYLPDGMEAMLITMVTPPSYGGYEWPF